jgi:hypothetical protein
VLGFAVVVPSVYHEKLIAKILKEKKRGGDKELAKS